MRTTELIIAVALIAGCRSREEKIVETRKAVEVDQPIDPEAETRRIDIENERAMLTRDLEERTKQLDQKIDELEARGNASAAAELRAERDDVRAKLSEIDNTTRSTWQAFKKDVMDAWTKLERQAQQTAMR